MANLTITLDDDLLRQARIRAIERGTSVNAVLRDYLYDWTETGARHAQAVERILGAARASSANSQGAHWSRDELYDQ